MTPRQASIPLTPALPLVPPRDMKHMDSAATPGEHTPSQRRPAQPPSAAQNQMARALWGCMTTPPGPSLLLGGLHPPGHPLQACQSLPMLSPHPKSCSQSSRAEGQCHGRSGLHPLMGVLDLPPSLSCQWPSRPAATTDSIPSPDGRPKKDWYWTGLVGRWKAALEYTENNGECVRLPHLSPAVGEGGRLLEHALVEDVVKYQFLSVKSLWCEDRAKSSTGVLWKILIEFWAPACKSEAL